MKLKAAILFAALATTGAACKKSGGGGGGGGWLVGSEGLMANVDERGHLGAGYDLGQTETLNGIACRYLDEAWVVGDHGTLLHTSDAGATWQAQDLGTIANLRALATQDAGAVFVAGDGVFFTANPSIVTGEAQWQQLGDGATKFRSIAAAQRGTTVLAVSEDGGIWSYANSQLTRVTTLAGMRAVALSPDGDVAVAVGDGIFRSFDGGANWERFNVDAAFSYNDVRLSDDGNTIVAVGNQGLVSRIVWDDLTSQHVGSADLLTVHIAPGDYDVATGYVAGIGGQVWVTGDSGATWKMGPNVGHTVLGVDEIGDGHR